MILARSQWIKLIRALHPSGLIETRMALHGVIPRGHVKSLVIEHSYLKVPGTEENPLNGSMQVPAFEIVLMLCHVCMLHKKVLHYFK